LEQVIVALDNGLAIRPPLGFNNWYEMPLGYPPWRQGFNESELRRIATTLVSTGLRDKGYKTVTLDCGWSTGYRTHAGRLQVNSSLFPSAAKTNSLRPLSDALGRMGLDLGIYTSGRQCCGPADRNDGSNGHEDADAEQFAEWGIKFVKDDDCGSDAAHFRRFSAAILKNRSAPMIYFIHSPWTHHNNSHPNPAESAGIANAARTSNDNKPEWSAILERAHQNNAYAALARPGFHNDANMMEVGNGNLTTAESRSHFALCASLAQPIPRVFSQQHRPPKLRSCEHVARALD
jgi:alpha-galactosidase